MYEVYMRFHDEAVDIQLRFGTAPVEGWGFTFKAWDKLKWQGTKRMVEREKDRRNRAGRTKSKNHPQS